MSDDDHHDFEKHEGGSHTYPIQAGSLKKGGYVVINGRPAKVEEVTFAKTGKHGHAKASIMAYDIFNNKKYEDSQPSSHNMSVPNVTKSERDLIFFDGDKDCTTTNEDGEEELLSLPKEADWDWIPAFKADYAKNVPIVLNLISAMGETHIVGYKIDKN